MTENDKMYELICKERFDNLENKTDEILKLLKGEGNNTGIVGDVQMLKKAFKYTVGAFIFIISAIVLQVIAWIREKVGG